MTPRTLGVEQSNTSIAYGTSFLLKLFRVLEEGPNAELEIGRLLSLRPDYHGVPPLAGALEYRATGQRDREPGTLGVLSTYIANQGDAWTLTMDSHARYYDRVLASESGEPTSLDGSLVERAQSAPDDRVIDSIGA